MLLIGILTSLFWWYSNKKLSYWKDRNVPYAKPLPFFGSLIDLATTPMHVLELNRYFSLGPIHGFFEGLRPVLVVGDPKLIRDIFITDFQIFPNRRVFQGCPILSRSLLISEGDYWRRIRSIVSPTFTTKKLKRILGIFEDCSKTLVQNFKISAQKEKPLSVKRIFNAFVLDVTASSAFSTKIDSLNDSKSEFVQQVNKNFGIIHKSKLCLMLLFTSWHHLKNIFKSSAVNGSALQFFSDFIKEVISERKRTKQTRDDFLQLLLDIEKKSTIDNEKEYVENDDDIDTNYGENISGQNIFPGESQKNLTHEELVSQCVTFLVAANDTTASLLTTTTHILATNESIQEKAYQEVAKHLQETNGKLTYEALQKMKYLDNIMSETLRLYPPVMRVCRRAEKEYNLGETGINIQKGVVVLLPILALHRDPKYYPDPEKFDPDRFSDEEVAKRDPNTYLPFGHGPRTCIGMRFAQLSAKVCLVYIISSFVIKSCSQTKIPMELLKDSYFTLQAKDVTVKLEIRKDCPLV
uniref:Cytochrome P450 3A11 n=1 Tax=Parasteatoda tepidariorum TaxID=114398 RepID=A0A2L2Y8V1_PARTP